MSYQVLARKWRPRTFDAVVGQEHVVRALSNALELDRIHHAYLFSGTRGVGKTTLARILAKCLNCEKGMTAIPCGQCSACAHIDQGKFVDLIEIDAASRTGIDDMRELLDNVQYLPVTGSFKIYLIDEVHMLSISSFNALLKTLEEPPEHVKFFFATTHPQKLPVTILSRCLQFNLTRVNLIQLKQYLAQLLRSEAVPFDEAAVHRIALSAEGSVRDALSLLDQAIAHGNGELRLGEIEAMLGIAACSCVTELLQHIVHNQPNDLLQKTAVLYANGVDFESLLGDVIALLHEIAVYQAVAVTDSSGQFKSDDVIAFAKIMAPEDIQLFYHIALQGKRDLPVLPVPRNAFEMTLLRMLSFKPLVDADSVAAMSSTAVRQDSSDCKEQSSIDRRSSTPGIGSPGTSVVTTAPAVAAATEYDTKGKFASTEGWIELINDMGLQGATRELCYRASPSFTAPAQVCLTVDPAYATQRSDAREAEIGQAMEKVFGRKIEVQFKVGPSDKEVPAQWYKRQEHEKYAAMRELIESNPHIKELQTRMGATIVPGSIKPVRSDAD